MRDDRVEHLDLEGPMAYEAENVAGHMHGAIGGVAQAAIAAWMMSSQQTDARRIENQAACTAAASRARAAVMAKSAEQLRERLADAAADLDYLGDENALLRAQVAELTKHRAILADALVEARRRA